ncbi:hypothetical protein E2986_13500, partial [Frieseomelitta varia]
SISPSIEINIIRPPKIIEVFNYTEIPLLDTFTLITSGFFITLSHLYFLKDKFSKRTKILLLFVIGLYFSIIQIKMLIFNSWINFFFFVNRISWNSCISWNISIISLIRLFNLHFSLIHHINFELSI